MSSDKKDTKIIINGDCIEELKNIQDKSIDLVILDPPYWKVVNESWDNQWRTINEYVEWCNSWIKEISRVIKLSGSVYLFGYTRNMIPLYDSFINNNFIFRQDIIIDKGKRSLAGRKTSTYKMFPTTTENLWFFKYDSDSFIRKFLKDKQLESGLTNLEINQFLGMKKSGGGLWSIYTGNNIIKQIPTRETWSKLQHLLNFDLAYEEVAPTFNIELGVTNVWSDIDFYKEKRSHPTQKPHSLVERIIKASSVEGMTILDPFAGSGITGVVCEELKRNYILIEKDLDYYNSIVNILSK